MKSAVSRPIWPYLLLGGLALAALAAWAWPHLHAATASEAYLPHAYCFLWNKHLIVLHVASDGLIGLSYMVISALLGTIAYQNRRLIPFRWMFLAFGAFIVCCGITHWLEILVFWRPDYWLEGEAKLVTALVSLFTACSLLVLAPRIKKLLLDAEISDKAQQQREQAFAFTRSIIESSAFTIIVTDLQGNIKAANPAAERLLWYTPKELMHTRNVFSFYDPQQVASNTMVRSAELSADIPAGFGTLVSKASRGLIDEGEWTFIRKDDAKIPVHVTVTSLKSEDDEDGFMFTAFDITERLRSQEYIRHVATHDSLTGLPSRILLRDRLEVALTRARRFGELVAVLMLDLDNFKRINDSLGHHAGDEVLIVIAERLRECIRKTDTVARMGGDEFMVVLTDIQEKMVDTTAENILRVLAEPISLNGQDVYITASIGICSDFKDGDPVTLLKHADIALYKSKAEGKNQISRFSVEMARETIERLQMETGLRGAVMRDELRLQYQPQVSLVDQQMIGIEALVRWPRGGTEVIMPSDFIPLAEETGLIVGIGEWVLRTACIEAVRLIEKLGHDIIISVNMSPRQFKDRGVFHTLRNALDESQLPPHCLELEITENVLMQGSAETLEGLARIRKLGVRIAIDDFGTGFSSMSYITRFQIDRIKIDKSFVSGILNDPNSLAVVTAIIAMAHGLGIKVIAEGTETKEEVALLRELGCDEAQGYYFARPVNPDKLADLTKSIPTI